MSAAREMVLGSHKFGATLLAVSTCCLVVQTRCLRYDWFRGVLVRLRRLGSRRRLLAADEDAIPIAHAVVTEPSSPEEALPPPPPPPPPMKTSFSSESMVPLRHQCASERVVSLGSEGSERLVSSLRDQRSSSWSPDVVVVCFGREFSAHAAVLEATSPALAEAARRAVLVRSSGDSPPPRIRLEASCKEDADALELVLDFAYGALVTLTEENVERLLELSSKLRIGALVDECCAFVAQRTSASRACRVLALADKHKCTLLRRDVGLCVLRHFSEACGLFLPPGSKDQEAADEALKGFIALPRHILDEILADDRLCVDDESRVFLAAVAWLEADKSGERLGDADAVLALVRYYLVSAEFLADSVEPHPLMQSRACKDLVHAAYRWQALPPTRRAENAAPVRRQDDDDSKSVAGRNNSHVPVVVERGGESSSLHHHAAGRASSPLQPNRREDGAEREAGAEDDDDEEPLRLDDEPAYDVEPRRLSENPFLPPAPPPLADSEDGANRQAFV